MAYGKNINNMLSALQGVSENPHAPGFTVRVNEVGQLILTIDEDEVEEIEPVEAPPQIKFMWNGIKVNGFLHKAFIWKNDHSPQGKLPEGTITITAKNYKRFPTLPGLSAVNNSDSQSDYFENDRLYITPDSPYYKDANAAFVKKQERDLKLKLKHDERQGKNTWI